VLQATLTLPGIAGIVLTMGMAVDANVLIYERIKEEQRNGRSMLASIDTGFRRAMATIIDANMTHLIASLILFQLGSGPVRGFAVTLGVGIITSFFTAVMVTRLMVVTWLETRRPKRLAI
jgi:preprotein translocase subunit SecD